MRGNHAYEFSLRALHTNMHTCARVYSHTYIHTDAHELCSLPIPSLGDGTRGVEKLEVRVRVVGSENARKGFLGFLQRRSGSLAEVGARGGRPGGASGGGRGGRGRAKGKLGVGVEQLCLEVAPSILIDFICAHVSERANEPSRGKRERVKDGREGG